jgi:hypothetical protein
VPTTGLLLEAAQLVDEMRLFREQIPSSRVVFERIAGAPEPSGDQTAREFIALVDGARDLVQIAALLRLREYDATRLAFDLVTAGLVRIVATDGHAEQTAGQAMGPRELIAAANGVLARMLVEARQTGREEVWRTAPAGFFVLPIPHASLFGGVGFDEEGRVHEELLLGNAVREAEESGEGLDFLGETLVEFLSFGSFVLCDGLAEEAEASLRERLRQMAHESGFELD